VPSANSILGQLYDGPTKASRMAIFNLGLLFGGMAGFGVGLSRDFPRSSSCRDFRARSVRS